MGDGADYRCVVRQAVLAAAGAVPGRRSAWVQNLGIDAAGEIVVREAAADLWGVAEDTGGVERDLDLGIVHVGRYRGGSPHLGVVMLFGALDRIRVGRHLLVIARTPDPFRVRDDGLWSRIVPHTVYVSGDCSALWVTRGTRPTSGRPSLVVVAPPRPDTPPARPARRVVRREK